MPQLLITRPRKQRPIPINRALQAAGLAAADPGDNRIGPCPHCGEAHAWTKADAHLAGDAPKPPPSGRREDRRR